MDEPSVKHGLSQGRLTALKRDKEVPSLTIGVDLAGGQMAAENALAWSGPA